MIAQVASSLATANSAGASVATLNVVLGVTPTAGNTVIAAAAFFGTSSTPGAGAGVFSATGIEWSYAGLALQGGSQLNLLLGVGRVFAGPSATITFTGVGTGGIALAAVEYSGLSGLIDRRISATNQSTSAATGATGTTSSAEQLWIGAVGSRGTNGVTFSAPTNSFSILAQDKSALNTSADRSLALLARIVSATGAANLGATISASNIWVAQVLTLEAAAATGGGGSGGGAFTFA